MILGTNPPEIYRESVMENVYPCSNVSLRVLRNEDELGQIRAYWEAHQGHPNSAFELFRLTVSARPDVVRPNVIVLLRDGSPDALLIGRLERQRLRVTFGYRSFLGPSYRCMVYIYQGLLGNQSAENVVRLLAHALKALRDDEADAIYFSGLDVGSTLCVGAAGTGGLLMRDGFPRISAHWILELPSEPDQFYARLSAKVRGKRKQEANRIFRTFGGNVRVRCFVHPHELDEMARDIESVAKLTYHRGMGVGFNLDVETIERLKIEACSQRLRAYVLYLADKPSAFFVGTVYKRTMYLHYTGYDPSQARYSSGAYLLLKIVESLCGSPVERMDFGFGHAWYKEMFCTRSWNESSFYVFAPTIKGRCLNLIRTPPLLAANIAKRIVALFHLAERIKRSWRNALRRRPQPESSAAESSSADRSFTRTA